MADALMVFLAFSCGGFIGFIAAAFFSVGRKADEPEEFDGGFRANYQPPVRTVIWGGGIDEDGRK